MIEILIKLLSPGGGRTPAQQHGPSGARRVIAAAAGRSRTAQQEAQFRDHAQAAGG